MLIDQQNSKRISDYRIHGTLLLALSYSRPCIINIKTISNYEIILTRGVGHMTISTKLFSIFAGLDKIQINICKERG